MNREDKKQYRAFLDDICSEYCHSEHYCILKEYLISSHPQVDLLLQNKCVEKFKYEKGKELDREIDWSEGYLLWIKEGYAKKFREVYEEDMKFSVLYKKIRHVDKK